jgi:hypothetical protein
MSTIAKAGIVLAVFCALSVALVVGAVAAGPDGWGRPILLAISYPCGA